MTQPLHTLKHEHRVIERALHALDGICMRMLWGERVSLSTLSQLVDFISNYADCYHHGKEEAFLFPALEQLGIAHEGGPLGIIERQHEIERELTDTMVSALDGYRDLDPESAHEFIEALVAIESPSAEWRRSTSTPRRAATASSECSGR